MRSSLHSSLQAIEDRFGTNVKNGTIKISIIRSAEVGLPFKKEQLDEIYEIAKKSIDNIMKFY